MKLPFISSVKAKQIQRSLHSFRLTLICGVLTLLVLRGTLGAGKFGTPAQDFEEIRSQFKRVHLHRKQLQFASRVLKEVEIQKKPTMDLVKNGVEVAQDEVIMGQNEGTQFLNDVRAGQNAAEVAQNDVKMDQNGVKLARMDVKSSQEDAKSWQNDVKMIEEIVGGKPYRLGPKVTNWDSERIDTKLSSQGKPRTMLITGSQPSPCDNPLGDNFLLKSMKNKLDYCRLHGLEIFYNTALLDDQMSGFWAKLPLLRRMMLTHPQVEWFWWMDSDALFTDMAFEIPLQRYDSYNLVLHGWEDMVYKEKNWVGLNMGSFLIRNCQWSLDLLDAWANFEADDRSALVHLLAMHKQAWGDKVFMENSYYLHGSSSTLVDKYEDRMVKSHNGSGDHRWPFITHFVGCKPCNNNVDDGEIASTHRCFKQMERAFNFADNQVLELYGFEHQSLSTYRVREIQKGAILSSDH